MTIDRRRFLVLGTAAAAAVSPALAAPSPDRARSASMPRISACAPAAPTTRAARSSAPSMKPRATARRSRSRPAAIASATCGSAAMRQLIGVRGATKLLLSDSASLIAAAGADHVTLTGLVLDGQRRRLPDRRGLCSSRTPAASGSPTARSSTPAAPPSSAPRSTARSPTRIVTDSADVAIHSLRRARAPDRAQHHHRRRQQRHPGLARQGRRRRHHRHRQPHRGDRQPLRRLRPVRQRHQRLPRRQRDRARQPHPELRVHGGARQCRLQHPDRRQQHQRRARGRASMPSSASRAR